MVVSKFISDHFATGHLYTHRRTLSDLGVYFFDNCYLVRTNGGRGYKHMQELYMVNLVTGIFEFLLTEMFIE